MTSPAERQFIQACKDRQNLDDREFYDTFYLDTEISMDTCSRVRKVLRTQLNMSNVRPNDNVASIFDDIDFGEICFEIGEGFQFQFPDDMIDTMDGTVDSIMRMSERLRLPTADDDAACQHNNAVN
jgi:hypothetical protein